MPESNYFNPSINNAVAFMFSENIPTNLQITAVDKLSSQWGEDLATIAGFNESQKSSFFGKIIKKDYQHLDSFLYSLKVVLLRLQGTLDNIFGVLSTAHHFSIIEKLREEITGCLEGTHSRVDEIVRTFIVPKNILDLLQLVREDLVLQVACSSTNDNVHYANAVFTVANRLDLGIRVRNACDSHSNEQVETNFYFISTQLIQHFQHHFRPFKLPFLLREQLQTFIAHCYVGSQDEPGYTIGDCEKITHILNQFLYSDEAEYRRYDAYFLAENIKEDDELFFFKDLDWKAIEILMFNRLEDLGCFHGSLLTTLPIETLEDAAYCSRLLPSESPLLEELFSNRGIPFILQNNHVSTIEGKEFFLRASPALIDLVLFNKSLFCERNFNFLASCLPLDVFIRWVDAQRIENYVAIQYLLARDVGEFVAQNLFYNRRMSHSIFMGLLLLTQNMTKDQKMSFMVSMSKVPEDLEHQSDFDTISSTSSWIAKLERRTCFFPMNRPLVQLVQQDQLSSSAWARLIVYLAHHKIYSFAPCLVGWLEDALSQEQPFNITDISIPELWEYLEAALIEHKNQSVIICFLDNVQDFLLPEHMAMFIKHTEGSFRSFIKHLNDFCPINFLPFYTVSSEFFKRLFLKTPVEYLPDLLKKMGEGFYSGRSVFLNAIERAMNREDPCVLNELLSFLSHIENRVSMIDHSFLMDRKILNSDGVGFLHGMIGVLLENIKSKKTRHIDAIIDFLNAFLKNSSLKKFEIFWGEIPDHRRRLAIMPSIRLINDPIDNTVTNVLARRVILSDRSMLSSETNQKMAHFILLLIYKIQKLSEHFSTLPLNKEHLVYSVNAVICYTRMLYQSHFVLIPLLQDNKFFLPPEFEKHKPFLEKTYFQAVSQILNISPKTINDVMKNELTNFEFHRHQWKQYKKVNVLTEDDQRHFKIIFDAVFKKNKSTLGSCCSVSDDADKSSTNEFSAV